MSNKVQINCNPANKMRVSLLKQEWIKLETNQQVVEKLEEEISNLETQTSQTQMAIQDPYHPDNNYYENKKWYLEQVRHNVRIIRMWIRIYSSDLAERTS